MNRTGEYNTNHYTSVSKKIIYENNLSVSKIIIWCWWGNQRERDHWGDQGVGGRIILRCIFRKWEGVVGTGWSWLRIGTDGGRL
jgi:hypothetical protein